MNETYVMNTVEQTFSVAPAQRAAAVQTRPEPTPKPASVLTSPAFWAIALAGFFLYSNSK